MIFTNFTLDRGQSISYTLCRMIERTNKEKTMGAYREYRDILILTFWAFVALM